MSCFDFSNLTKELIDDIYENYIKDTTQFIDTMVKNDKITINWNNYIEKFIQYEQKWNDKLNILKMSHFHEDKTIRDYCSNTTSKINQFDIEQNMRKDLFEQFRYYYYNQFQQDKLIFSEERNRYIEKAMQQYKIIGLELENSKYEKVKELKKEISTLCTNFGNNMNNYNKEFILSNDDLLGMDDTFLESRRLPDCKDKYKITLKYPDYIPIMEKCKNRETRKMMNDEFNRRCYDENKDIINKILDLKKKLANELGFELYSDYKLQDKMAKNTKNVLEFLNDIENKIKPLLENDYKKLLSISVLDDIKSFDELKYYDMSYYSKLYEEKELDIDMEDIKKYFILDDIVKGTFDIYESLFGYKFVDVSFQNSHKFWNTDVKLFQVINTKDSTLQGEFYLDLYPREGKYSHAAVFPIRRGSIYGYPICIMCCNFPKNECLMFNNLITFFHEFGHVMHNISSATEIPSMSGTAVVRDAVECPSKMFEEFCYCPLYLKKLCPMLPCEYIEKLSKKKNLLNGYLYGKQLTYAYTDMYLHSNNNIEPNELYRQIVKKILNIDLPSDIGFIQTFNHIFNSSYDAGYYGYMYSESIALCLFDEKFKDKELDPTVGMEFREKILAKGNTSEFMTLVNDFLGKQPTNEAFVKALS